MAPFALLGILFAARRRSRRKPVARPRIKPAWLYWFWRIYVPVAYVGVFAMFARLVATEDERLVEVLFCVGFPMFLAAKSGSPVDVIRAPF